MRQTLLRSIATLERLGSPEPRLADARNFLLLQHPLALGTAVHATPLVRALHEAVPGCRIAVAASGFGLDVFRNHPLIEQVIETPSPIHHLLGATRALRHTRPFGRASYVVLTSNGNQRTRVALQAVLAGARPRVGFSEAPELYRVALRFNSTQSQIRNNLRLVEALGHTLRVPAYEPEVFYTRADLLRAQSLLEQAGVDSARPIAIMVTQTSPTQQKGWRAERFQEIAAWLQEQWRAQVVFVGAGNEAAAIDALRNGLQFSTANLAGRTSLTELCALLSLCDVGVTLDTGTLHLGRSVGLPMVVIAPAWSPPVEWLPVGDTRFEILKGQDLTEAPQGYVIDEVSVADVQAATGRLLGRFPPGTRQGRRGLRNAR